MEEGDDEGEEEGAVARSTLVDDEEAEDDGRQPEDKEYFVGFDQEKQMAWRVCAEQEETQPKELSITNIHPRRCTASRSSPCSLERWL